MLSITGGKKKDLDERTTRYSTLRVKLSARVMHDGWKLFSLGRKLLALCTSSSSSVTLYYRSNCSREVDSAEVSALAPSRCSISVCVWPLTRELMVIVRCYIDGCGDLILPKWLAPESFSLYAGFNGFLLLVCQLFVYRSKGFMNFHLKYFFFSFLSLAVRYVLVVRVKKFLYLVERLGRRRSRRSLRWARADYYWLKGYAH